MIKRLLLIFLAFIMLSGLVQAQQPVWYNYDQTYYKIPTATDGIHRISATTLSSSGINLNSLDPRNIRLYHRGKEVAIHISGENDGRFDSGDFIDFYGMRNDATLDKLLYTDFDQLPNPYFNTTSDTTAFFLTVTTGQNGKRMNVRTAPELTLPQAASYSSESLIALGEQYSLGVGYAFEFRLSKFDQGQGWMSAVITKGNTRQLVFKDLGAMANSGAAKLEIGLVGRSYNAHSTRILAGPTAANQRLITTVASKQFEYPQLTLDLIASDFNADGSIVIGVNAAGAEAADNVSVAFAKITFQNSVSKGDFTSELFISPAGNQRILMPQVAGNYSAIEISDPGNPQKVLLTKNGQELSFRSAVAGDSSKVWVQNETSILVAKTMERVKFRNYLAQPANYILVGHQALEQPTTQFTNPLKAYAEHRASPAGGGFDTLTVKMADLYNQFSYGEYTPTAIYEFLRAYYPIHKPTHMLLAGRSLAMYSTSQVSGVTHFYRNNPAAFSFRDLIPAGGYPFSDNIYTLDLDPSKPLVPALAIGRIPARNAQQLADYLDKAIEKDAVGISESWQKELVHLSGGESEFELERYFNFMNGFKTIAEGPYLGGKVTTYRKRSNSTIEVIDITGDLNEGRSMLTFFGHGAPTVIDIEIGFASDPTLNYQNKGKYPVMLFNGCDYGAAFGNSYTQGEDWVITADKGAVSVIANSSIGVDVYLRRYSDMFYRKAFSDSSLIYRTLGEVKQEAEEAFISEYGTTPINYSHMEQMINYGDPGLRIFPADKADYAIKIEEVSVESFDEIPVSVLSDSLKLSFVLRNIGRVDTDSIEYKVTRRLPDGSTEFYDPVKIPYIARIDSLFFTIPNTGLNSAGENSFTIEVNSARDVEEMTFANNSISYIKFIPLSGTLNLYPLDYGIVNGTEAKLIAQVPGKTTEDRTVIIQVDTAATFNSAYRKEVRVTTRGLAEMPLSLTAFSDSITFYWRSKFQEAKPGETDTWTNSSFSYIPSGPNGWTQRTSYQLGEDQLTNLEIKESDRTWKYTEIQEKIEVFTVGAAVDTLSFRNTQFYLDQIPQIIDNVNNANSRLCPNGSLGLVAFEQKSLVPYLAIPVPGFDILDGRACGRLPQMIQSIQNAWITTPGQTMLVDYVNKVKTGDYVIIFSVGNVTFEAFPDIAIEKLKEFGASEATLRALKSGDPYILYGRKGMRPGEAIEIVGDKTMAVPANQQTLSFDTELSGYLTSGMILTPRVGPASNWERFFQHVNSRNWINEEEKTYFDIIGVKENGEEDLLVENTFNSEMDLSFISTDTYPYLKLRYSMNDTESTAPAQLDKWQVNYTGVPEGVLILKSAKDQVNLREGEAGLLELQFKNISKYNFLDSIQVDWKITNLTSKKVENFSKKFPALKAGEAFDFTIEFNSIGNTGENSLEIFANPRIQREQTFRNNQVDMGSYFLVEGDNSTALLDVNFDGIYIMDGDIVSPNVLITALLKNNQTLLYKKDTVGLELFLKQNCESCDFKRVNFSNPNLTWTPASEDEDFKVSLLAGPLEDGIYTLRVANEDSTEPYEITFEVINESQITNFYPYPNPFSTSVRFVFTVTGMEVPDEIKIQIMTVTGKVVREILQNELGPIRIGNNLTEYAWDGKDEFGDQLANGVYIYRVLVRKNGQFMEHRPTAGDKAFKKGYGKMYLLR
ncbi:peptidase C25-like protein [Algoriphagus ratkowskyi]|uniref:Peptidase C25-like protein n=1 Tax=Algoriphagus ratkowskyi TaxID=57028 RepID=A0A2W7RR44_9BACT|nr:C25 family cysteine peptidase [Algoriphagus ratkowskyi]PZX61020.1 peptidase C25-like protein [Algoriphagus ratkowskyi]TXD79157.1 transporter [Algoriphagus ratkowskyi]